MNRYFTEIVHILQIYITWECNSIKPNFILPTQVNKKRVISDMKDWPYLTYNHHDGMEGNFLASPILPGIVEIYITFSLVWPVGR